MATFAGPHDLLLKLHCEVEGQHAHAEEHAANIEKLVRIGVQMVLEPALRVMQGDPHAWSARPCQTCRAVSALVGRPFGCSLYAALEQESKRA